MNNIKDIEMPPIEQEEVVEEPIEETEQPEEEKPAEPVQQSTYGNQENIRQLREARERAERERDELLTRLRKIEESQRPPVEDSSDIEIGADDFVEGKHLKSYAKKVKELEKQLNSYKQQTDTSVVETRLKAQYQDFDSVVSQQNIDALRVAYPEIANTINSNNDLYSKAVAAYTLIKKLGIHKEDTFVNDRARAQKNAAKPRPLTSVSPQEGDSPLAQANAFANGLTDELRKQLYKEMMDARG